MSRIRRIELYDRIFFVTTNLDKNVAPLSSHERDLVILLLGETRASLGFLILGYVVMPNHVHVLLRSSQQSVSDILHQWKFKAGYRIQANRGNRGAFWQSRYFDFICRRNKDVSDKLEYMHENPVAARLVQHSDDWRWSSAGFYSRKCAPPLMPDHLEFSGSPNQLIWAAPWRKN